MRQTDNNHFIPRFLLAQFANGGRLHVYTRVGGGWKHSDRAVPRKTGRQKHLYDQATEDWFENRIETPSAPLVKRLADGEPFSALSDDEQFCVRTFIASLDLRTPKSDAWLTPAFEAAAIRGGGDLVGARRSLRAKGLRVTKSQVRKAYRRAEPGLKEMGKPAWLDYIKTRVPMARLAMSTLAWTVTTAESGAEFITSDVGIAKGIGSFENLVPHQFGLAEGRYHWVVPISSRRALLIHPEETEPITASGDEFVDRVRRRIVLDAVTRIYASNSLEGSLLGSS